MLSNAPHHGQFCGVFALVMLETCPPGVVLPGFAPGQPKICPPGTFWVYFRTWSPLKHPHQVRFWGVFVPGHVKSVHVVVVELLQSIKESNERSQKKRAFTTGPI